VQKTINYIIIPALRLECNDNSRKNFMKKEKLFVINPGFFRNGTNS